MLFHANSHILALPTFAITFPPKTIRKRSSKSLSLSYMRTCRRKDFSPDTERRQQHEIIGMSTKKASGVREKKNSRKEATIEETSTKMSNDDSVAAGPGERDLDLHLRSSSLYSHSPD